jgi:hypothetical protein
MSEPFDIPEPGDDEDQNGPFPWDEPEDPDAPSANAGAEEGPRQRHDAFTEARKSAFLKALVKTGCIIDAARKIGINPRTIYRHQQDQPTFHDHCMLALRMSATPVELTAWQRAVDGVEQEFAVGGQVHVRRRYDAGLLRLLLQGSNPKKYGPRPGFKRKRLLKHERKAIEREVRADIEMRMEEPSIEEVTASIIRKIDAIERHEEPAKLAAGWTKSPDGHWIPPGYGPLPGYVAPNPGGEGAGGEEPPCDSM